MENEEQEQLSVGVTTVVERFIAELAKTNRRIDELESMIVAQQAALKDSLATLRAVVEGKRNWPRPSATKARSN